jgi:fumarate reductase flavoprotein subunit
MSKGEVEEKDYTADVAVIGAGGAGLPAAVAAAEKGASVVVVEKQKKHLGGNAVFALGIFAAQSNVQERLGIAADRDRCFRKGMDYAHWKNNPRVLRALVDKSADTIEWLEEKGLKIDLVAPLYPDQAPLVCHVSTTTDKLGATVMRLLADKAGQLGVRFIASAQAKRLIVDREGKVSGVAAETGHDEITVRARSVVIATGGFLGNRALLRQYLQSYDEGEFFYAGNKYDGDGLRMATEVGAATEGMAVLEMEGPTFPWSRYLSVMTRRPNTIWINTRGERFVDEAMAPIFTESANAIYRQPGKVSYAVFDESIKEMIFGAELSSIERHILGSAPWSAKADKDLQANVEKGRVKISSSLEEMARWIGAPPDTLKAEIEAYNNACVNARDPIFAKDRRYLVPLVSPPYYAIRCCISLLTTHGGIKVNHRMEVVDNDDNPICGLYAAGVDAGGTDFDTYNIHLTAHSFGFSVNSGRIAGENAAHTGLKGY